MRALSVLAVLLYHADVSGVAGGYLGVETFFVVSGYLITSLLMHEQHTSGRVAIGSFWWRRARRLFPALWALLLVVPTYAALCLPEELYELRRDLTSALLYVTNWQQIWSAQSYFEQTGRPALLKHLWSLAVEEQFYLLWPLFFAYVLRRAGQARALGLLLGLAAASALWMALLYDPSVDPSRVYYGSDTRAFGLLLGAALALALPLLANRLAPYASVLAALGAAGLLMAFLRFDELASFVYPLGLLWVDLATCCLVAGALLAPQAKLAALLSTAPLRWLGKRSYSLYLWHWPVFAVTRPGLDVAASGTSNLLLRLAVSLLLAELSYRLVEEPVRRGVLERALSSLRMEPWAKHRRRLVRLAASMAALLLVLAFTTRALVLAEQPKAETLTLAGPPSQRDWAAPIVTPLSAAEQARTLTRLPEPLPAHDVLAIGDSVMLGAKRYLGHAAHHVEVDAEVGRTPLLTLALLKKRKAKGALSRVVIIHLGNNGPFQAEHFDRMMELLSDVPRVVFVTAKVPRRLGDFNNRTIREGAQRHPRVLLVDWQAASKEHVDWFRSDGLHLRESGATAYAALLAQHY